MADDDDVRTWTDYAWDWGKNGARFIGVYGGIPAAIYAIVGIGIFDHKYIRSRMLNNTLAEWGVISYRKVKDEIWEGPNPEQPDLGDVTYSAFGYPDENERVRRIALGSASEFSLLRGKRIPPGEISLYFKKLDNNPKDYVISSEEVEGRFIDYAAEQAKVMSIADIVSGSTTSDSTGK